MKLINKPTDKYRSGTNNCFCLKKLHFISVTIASVREVNVQFYLKSYFP